MKKDVTECVIQIIDRVKQLATGLKAMDFDVHNQRLAMKILCWFPFKLEHHIVAIDALVIMVKLILDFVGSSSL